MIDYEKQEKLEDNCNNKLRQKLAKQALYCKNGAALYIVFFGQLHSDIVTIAKRSIVPLFETVYKKRAIVGMLPILHSICVQNLTRSKVDLYLEQLKTLSSTLSYVQKRAYLITILVTPYMTSSLLPRVSAVYLHLVTTITPKC